MRATESAGASGVAAVNHFSKRGMNHRAATVCILASGYKVRVVRWFCGLILQPVDVAKRSVIGCGAKGRNSPVMRRWCVRFVAGRQQSMRNLDCAGRLVFA